ncbi:hypothetical protein Z517_10553 [Fonsecaea pedrosoi CBS 271.37]|uniref:Unplaced genomic scaffold supercont1.7, whole genome shotgun sequence n=1 Tax=Fonsecaea pedrosoi CBS 271.37 TaxID=1442368 RepID=A0A0D2GTP5_9EURO|nr:uncharacterized protein Z517_10553 [Fonsecaea pedrosoi CBS 271.37]KIW75809.1 hypothetical protein Z517_10553 [Fonsecaea pedrosoi CBS 271.37]
MSDTGRKPLTDRSCNSPLPLLQTRVFRHPNPLSIPTEAQEKLTPDSQKSTLDKAKESATGTADDIAGMVQPGDSKSTTQKLADETSAKSGSVQDTLAGATKNIQETASTLGQQASSTAGAVQESGKQYLQQAQDTTSSVGQTASSNASAAQESSKTYLQQAQEMTANVLNSASKAASDLANSISGEKK